MKGSNSSQYALPRSWMPDQKYLCMQYLYRHLFLLNLSRLRLANNDLYSFFLWKKYEFTEIILSPHSSFCVNFWKVVYWFTIQYCISLCYFELTDHILSVMHIFSTCGTLLPSSGKILTMTRSDILSFD